MKKPAASHLYRFALRSLVKEARRFYRPASKPSLASQPAIAGKPASLWKDDEQQHTPEEGERERERTRERENEKERERQPPALTSNRKQ